jgi:hypothetical protein
MKTLDKGIEARRAARNKAAKPGATRRIPDRRRKLLDKVTKKEERS